MTTTETVKFAPIEWVARYAPRHHARFIVTAWS